jgi:hypothetical protein
MAHLEVQNFIDVHPYEYSRQELDTLIMFNARIGDVA